MPVRAVLFDLDLTLWRVATAALPQGGLRSLADLTSGALRDRIREHQVERVRAAIAACLLEDDLKPGALSDCLMEDLDDLWRRLMSGGDADDLVEPDMTLRLGETVRKVGFELTPEQVLAIWAASYVPYPSFPLELYDDTEPTLRALAEKGVRIAVVTNTPWPGRVRQPDLVVLGLGDYVSALVASGDVGFRKPHAAVFQAALDALGARAADAVMVGDSLANDVVGARRLGMLGVWKRNGAVSEGTPEADFVIDHLHELLDLPPFQDL